MSTDPLQDDTQPPPAIVRRSLTRARSLRGNLNASRHPWRSFWRRRALRPEDRWILPLLETYAAGLIADRGGPDSMSSAELRLIEVAQLARGCTMLALAEAAQGEGIVGRRRSATNRKGAITQRVTDADLASTVGRFLNVERQVLQALGLERRRPPVLSLQEVLAQRVQDTP
jgi:hypothetical protein